MFELRSLSRDAIPAAQEKAVRYRLLNEPRLAESICRDIVAVDPDNQDALITLILAITDQFGAGGARLNDALALLPRLEGDFHRAYYRGIIYERRGMAQLAVTTPASGHVAYDWFRQAMEQFDEAEAISPPGNDDALLRWNTCARMINDHEHVRPTPEHRTTVMLE